MIRLIVLLGNPGSQYRHTRHNAAWLFADSCALFDSASWQSKFHGTFASPAGGIKVLKPATFMNKSGMSVAAAASFFSLDPEEILVVHDEVELSFGVVSFKAGGGTAGHNGLKSLRQSLGTGDFYRFRLGVARPSRGDVASYVLSRFSASEEPRLDDLFSGACSLMAEFLDSTDPKSVCDRGKTRVLPG